MYEKVKHGCLTHEYTLLGAGLGLFLVLGTTLPSGDMYSAPLFKEAVIVLVTIIVFLNAKNLLTKR